MQGPVGSAVTGSALALAADQLHCRQFQLVSGGEAGPVTEAGKRRYCAALEGVAKVNKVATKLKQEEERVRDGGCTTVAVSLVCSDLKARPQPVGQQVQRLKAQPEPFQQASPAQVPVRQPRNRCLCVHSISLSLSPLLRLLAQRNR